MPPRRTSFNYGRLATLACLGSICLAAAYMANALNEDQVMRGAVTALAFLLGGFLVAGLLNAIAAAMKRIDDLSRQMSETAADQASAARALTGRIDQAVGVARHHGMDHEPAPPLQEIDLSHEPQTHKAPGANESHGAQETHGAHEAPGAHGAPVVSVSPVGSGAPAGEGHASPVTDQRIVAMLEEIRELALMNDEERRQRLHQHLDSRKRSALEDVHQDIKDGQWARADRVLTELEIQFAGDAAVKKARGELLRLRDEAEGEAYRAAEERVQDLISVASWDRAIHSAGQFVENFPTSMKGRQLLTRVRHEHDQYRDGAFQRMYEEVQSRVDRHDWRDAMEAAQKLLDAFPTHSRSNRIRQQLKIINENAEIEERQEQEQRIQQLVRGRRFAEAVELAEDVVHRYPDSPQALAIDQMLPRLREMAEHGDENAEPAISG